MKKLLIILTFFFSTIFFTNNVSASDTPAYYKKFHSSTIMGYIYNYPNGIPDGFQQHYFDNFDNPIYHKDTIYAQIISNSDFKYCISWVGSDFSTLNYLCSTVEPIKVDGQNKYTITNGQYLNFPITYVDGYYYFTAERSSIQSGNTTINYDPNYPVITKFVESTPTISITKENETTVTIENETYISSVTLDIDFSIIDNEKYLYIYKYGFNSDWSTITLTNSSSFTKTFNTNDTLYVQILDKITQETVSSATYTIDSINYSFEPFVDITETIPTSCTFYKNGRTYTICKELNISAKNLEDGNYIASYSYNSIDWTNFVNSTIPLNENTTIYFKIVNYLTNEVSYRSTYTVGNIDTDISDLGVFNTYSSTYDKDTSFITAYINIYNLVEPLQDNYKIYYSFNSTSFTDITLLLINMTNYYQYEINNINENKTIYFKITDLNDNILYTSSYDINYQIQANENSNFFTNFRTNFHGLSDIISAPLFAIKRLNTGVCAPLEIPIPYTNKNISLPCMTSVYENNIPNIFNIWQIVTNGIISYYIILDLFRIVKSFKEPEEDKIEVIDL